jgi:hypothetical protein
VRGKKDNSHDISSFNSTVPKHPLVFLNAQSKLGRGSTLSHTPNIMALSAAVYCALGARISLMVAARKRRRETNKPKY